MLLHFVVAALVTVFAPVSSEPPEDVSWTASFVTEDEPGEPMVVIGTGYASDGKTPASGIVVYAYHTDAKGFYSKGGSGKHRIRGWMRTDRDGRYEIVQGLEIDAFSREKMRLTDTELRQERAAIEHLLGKG